MTANFLQIHTLTSYPAVLLNRDDIGRAKRLPFGGRDRIRVSSQCLKRHWRTHAGEWSLSDIAPDASASVRSRRIFSDDIAPRLERKNIPPEDILGILAPFCSEVIGESKEARANRKKQAGKSVDEAEPFKPLRTEQVIVLGKPEIREIAGVAERLAGKIGEGKEFKDGEEAVKSYFKDKETKNNLKALVRGAGIDAALFGRMVTSDVLARCDAAVHVAHSFTVHAEEAEPDYFSAVDDLVQEEGESGSGHINTNELTSGLFYGYAVVDLRHLAENMSGDRELAANALRRLVRLIAMVSPGAKLGSTAPYACAELVLAEAGARQPRTLANAFMDPVDKNESKGKAAAALRGYLKRFDAMYGEHEERRAAAMIEPLPVDDDERVTLDELAGWAAEKVPEPAR